MEVVDAENGWPVPLVKLETTHSLSWITDNAGQIAIDEPDCLGRETYFHVSSDGYEVAADGFGFRGVLCVPEEGESIRIEMKRTMRAKRLGRLTGAGLFAEKVKLGATPPVTESGLTGCDSVLLTPHRGKLFWLWGDSSVPQYPLGIFDTTAALTPLSPLRSFEPPISLDFDFFRDKNGKPRGVADLPGEGPTWLSGLASLPSANGKSQLVATYSKIENHLDEYEIGLCEWDEDEEKFQVSRVLWKKGEGEKPMIPRGHTVRWKDADEKDWLLFGDPFPTLRIPANFESWSDPATWKRIDPPGNPETRDGERIEAHRGSIAWNADREEWFCVFTQKNGKPSALGEIWIARSPSPFGPWKGAIKVLSHRNYTFYNPVLHPELAPEDADFLLFEGTYTAEFSGAPARTPRYDYNQILYRVEFQDLE